MADHLDGGCFHLRMVTQECRAFGVGGKHNRVFVWHFVVHDRETLTTPAGAGTKPGCHDRGRQLFGHIRRAGKDHRQVQRTVITRVEERHREGGEIVFQRQRLIGHLKRRVTPDIQPQGAAGRVFTDIAVVADKLQTHAVKVGDKQRVNRHLSQGFLTQLLFGDGQDVHQLVIQIDLKLGLHRQQRRRWGVFQVEHRFRHDFIAAHTEFDTAIWVDAAQNHAARRRRDLGKRQLNVTRRRIFGNHRRTGSRHARHDLPNHRVVAGQRIPRRRLIRDNVLRLPRRGRHNRIGRLRDDRHRWRGRGRCVIRRRVSHCCRERTHPHCHCT